MYTIQFKLREIRDNLQKELLIDGNLQTATTTLDFSSLTSRSPWEECVLGKIEELRPGINKSVYIDVTTATHTAAMTGIMTCVQDNSGFVELSVYNWIPRAYIKAMSDLDWAMPKGARFRIREPYLKQATLDPPTMMLLMLQNAFNPNISICRVVPYDKSTLGMIGRPLARSIDPWHDQSAVQTRSHVSKSARRHFGDGLYSKTHIQKDSLVLVEKAIVAAEGRNGFAFQLGKGSCSDINTYSLYEDLVFLNHCSGGSLYSNVVSRLFPANSDPDKSMLVNIHDVVESNTFGFRSSEEHKEQSTRPPHKNQTQTEQGSRSGLWNLASKMNHNYAPNTYISVVEDMMYVYARHNVPVGTELTMQYFDIDTGEVSRTFGLRGQKRYFVCACASCVTRKKAIHASIGTPELSGFDRLTNQHAYLIRGVLFTEAQRVTRFAPEQVLRILFKLAMALRDFEPGMEMTIQVYIAATEAAMMMLKMDLARTNMGLAFQTYKRCLRASNAEFRERFPYVESYSMIVQAALVP
ncbi:hypothetical protein EC957_009997 [Mortierella hygrophila]|uniref:SET domain-containing protein n=1 Tax=Mortierella hygrophila TaxID=979708 RepID=A0A9P6EWN1_9FUNG|nr:hypothetical protein EC957_009997 [Mortierella hygrophila]